MAWREQDIHSKRSRVTHGSGAFLALWPWTNDSSIWHPMRDLSFSAIEGHEDLVPWRRCTTIHSTKLIIVFITDLITAILHTRIWYFGKLEFLLSVTCLEDKTNNHYISDIFLPLTYFMIPADSIISTDNVLSSYETRKQG
jgi:hypothetical protein